MDIGAQDHGPRRGAVRAGRDAVGVLEGTRERLVRGKAVVERDVEKAALAVAHLAQGERQPPPAQIVAQLHPGDLAEFPRGVILRVAQRARKRTQRERCVVVAADAAVDLIDDLLDLPAPFIHPCSPRSEPLCTQYTAPKRSALDLTCKVSLPSRKVPRAARAGRTLPRSPRRRSASPHRASSGCAPCSRTRRWSTPRGRRPPCRARRRGGPPF